MTSPYKLPSCLAVIVSLVAGCGGGGGEILPAAFTQPDAPPPVSTARTLSGVAQAAAFTKADSDINDASTTPVGNNTPATAQNLPSQFRIGGYVALRRKGPEGAVHDAGDELDAYRVRLSEGQALNLFIGDPKDGDLALGILDQSGNFVEVSNSTTSNVESIIIGAAGEFLIAVKALSGFGNYVLATGRAPIATHSMHSSADFVPGEAVVVFQPERESNSAATAKVLQSAGLEVAEGTVGQPQLVRFSTGSALRAKAASRRLLPAWATVPAEMETKLATLATINEIAQLPAVAYAEPNLRRYAMRLPDDQDYRIQSWHYDQIRLPEAWDVTIGSPNVRVAVIDTGVLVNHPDLAPRMDSSDPNGFDFISDPVNARDEDGRDGNADDPGDSDAGLSSFHGTHVAGTVAAAGNNSIGVTGVNWNARIMPLRVLGKKGGESFDIVQALLYAAGLPNATGQLPQRRADIINLSLGLAAFSQAEQDAIKKVVSEGVIVVASAGNDGDDPFLGQLLNYPASYEGVVSVAATNISRNRAHYSQFNSAVDVAAPGGDISTDINNDGEKDGVHSTLGSDAAQDGRIRFKRNIYQGTSMAAPHVAGVAALMKAIFPSLTPAQFDELLASGQITDDLGEPGKDSKFGYGLINAAKAVRAAQGLAGIAPPVARDPTLAADPISIGFGSAAVDLELVLRNSGPSSLSISSVTDNQPWLTVVPKSVGADGTGTYRLTVNRGVLPAGAYAAEITAVSSANTLKVPVFMDVPTPNIFSETDVGALKIYLYNASTDKVVAETRLTANLGEYVFGFPEVADGNYYLVASTDRDNDLLICDPGEACGRYPVGLGSFRVSGSAPPTFSFPVSFDQSIAADLPP